MVLKPKLLVSSDFNLFGVSSPQLAAEPWLIALSESSHSHMLLAGIQANSGLDPRLKRSGVTTWGKVIHPAACCGVVHSEANLAISTNIWRSPWYFAVTRTTVQYKQVISAFFFKIGKLIGLEKKS